CCTSADEQGCTQQTIQRCAGCGPGTHVPCCDQSGRGCRDGETCVGSGDTASCAPCGFLNSPCCRRGNETTCSSDLACFRRSDSPTGNRCEACGGANQQPCPDGSCHPGLRAVGDTCQPCGGPGPIRCGHR